MRDLKVLENALREIAGIDNPQPTEVENKNTDGGILLNTQLIAIRALRSLKEFRSKDELDFSVSERYTKWFEKNRERLRNHSIFTKGSIVWNAAIEESAKLFDENPGAEEFRCNIVEEIRELKAKQSNENGRD